MQINNIMKKQTITRKKLITLLNMFSCGDWQSRIAKYLKSSALESDEYEVVVSDEDLNYVIQNGSAAQKSAVENVGIKLSEVGTVGNINSYEDACNILSEKIDVNASISDQILMIVKAANYLDNNRKSWVANFETSESKYLPRFIKDGSGWVFDNVNYWGSGSCCPVGFYFKNSATCEAIVKKFIAPYKQWLG